MADRLGFKRASGKLRSDLSLCDIAAQRSDAIPGRYVCMECNHPLSSLQEAWRKHGDVISNTACLFCAQCAMRLNETANLGLAPMQMNNFDKLNMGQFVPEFGVVAPPTQQAAGLQESKAAKWAKLLDSQKQG